ncbi:diacylglycerol kinase family protein [Candidatus Peribacteria bacterium]|nr:diacylglycerol kinase family protein [Candidatus Peribacteria bacterium]
MRSYIQSLQYALEGLFHALSRERNLKLFTALYLISLMIAVALRLTVIELALVIFTGGIFLAVELINTALERFTDAFDVHSKSIHTGAIKATKDIAAGASLVCAVTWGVILLMIFVPKVLSFLQR